MEKRDKLIEGILSIMPRLNNNAEFKNLDESVLEEIYKANIYISYYDLQIKLQKIYVINRIFPNKYGYFSLLGKDILEIHNIYLEACEMTEEEYQSLTHEAINELFANTEESSLDEIMSYNYEESLIASNFLINYPITLSLTKRLLLQKKIEEYNNRVKELGIEISETESFINDKSNTNYFETVEDRNDLMSLKWEFYNKKRKIDEMQDLLDDEDGLAVLRK